MRKINEIDEEYALAFANVKSKNWKIAGTSLMPTENVCELIYRIFRPRPYSYEDLSKGLWLWQSEFEEVLKIVDLGVNDLDQRYIEFSNGSTTIYREKTCFPVIIPDCSKYIK